MVIKQLFLALFMVLTCFVSGSQNIYVPDDNFENRLIELGLDTILNDSVPTANINAVTSLDVSSRNISDLTGIEGFTNLNTLMCIDNNLTFLNVSENLFLTHLNCSGNELTALDVTENVNLISLIIDENFINEIEVSLNVDLELFWCNNNRIRTLDLSMNTKLKDLSCHINWLNSLDLRNNPELTRIDAHRNVLCTLDMRNGTNTVIERFYLLENSNLKCIFVDNIGYSSANWSFIDPTSTFVNSEGQCQGITPTIPAVDVLPDATVMSNYTLPQLINGNYFTAPNGSGIMLSGGDVITSTQTIYIYRLNGCGVDNQSSFTITIETEPEPIVEDYSAPSFFTPNNDGYNDFWKVSSDNNSITRISIFNRYGKLLKSLRPNSIGWSGTYNGKPMITDDYWYIIMLKSGRKITGHFALKR